MMMRMMMAMMAAVVMVVSIARRRSGIFIKSCREAVVVVMFLAQFKHV
ncbi:MAG: hypothetical protein LBC07_03225 [Elusimicrobiota bacterium]|nr:hypothetical protein [Elusimicrobiota bacterium]